MKKETINRVDFSDIFNYAEKRFDIGWNEACDIFFGNSLDYKSYNEYNISNLSEFYEGDFDESPSYFEDMSDEQKSYYIIEQFMKEKDITDIFIEND